MMKWGKEPSHQLTVDSNWIQNTIRKIRDNSDALRTAPKCSLIAKILELCYKSITLSFVRYLNYEGGTWEEKKSWH